MEGAVLSNLSTFQYETLDWVSGLSVQQGPPAIGLSHIRLLADAGIRTFNPRNINVIHPVQFFERLLDLSG